MTTIGLHQEGRHEVSERSSGTFIPREEFCKLLLSNRKMLRFDERGGKVRGLLDVQSGALYLIEREELLRS